MKMTGKTGQLKVGGRHAATLGRWSFDGNDHGWTLEADTVAIDDYWFATSGPFTLHLEVGKQIWKWRGVTVTGQSRVTVSGVGRHEA